MAVVASTSIQAQGALLRLQRFESLQQLTPLRREWEDVVRRCPSSTIFSTREWLSAWSNAFGSGWKPLVLAFFDGDQLAGLALLQLGKVAGPLRLRAVRLMGDGSGDSDHLDLPVLPHYADAFAAALVTELERYRHQWDVCQFRPLPRDSVAGQALLRSLPAHWSRTVQHLPCSAIHLSHSWEQYLKQISRDERRNLRRHLERLNSTYHARFSRCSTEEALPQYLQALFDNHQKRWHLRGEPGSFACAARRAFYDEFSREFLRRDRLEFWLLELNGKAAAAEFAFRFGDRLHVLQSGFDPEYADYSVGFLLRAHVIKHAIDLGIRYYDFLGGNYAYKASMGAEAGHYLNICFARRHTLGALYLRAGVGMSAVKDRVKAHIAPDVWAKLRRVKRRILLPH